MTLASTHNVVVLLDLLRVDGNRFACVLPARLSRTELSKYIRPLAGKGNDGFDIFIGNATTPHAGEQDLLLADGTMITVVPAEGQAYPGRTFADLVAAPATWGPPEQSPRPYLKPGMCLLSEHKRYFLNRREYPGQPPAEAAARCAEIDTTMSMLRVARPPAFEDLTMHGNTCKGLACVVPIAPL